ncbi:hypothetical protein BC827DRAFT_574250 [Russula dissimulans]|nr:hypothetical protein BC827DRAFT_574250 [Russula dissimulans]
MSEIAPRTRAHGRHIYYALTQPWKDFLTEQSIHSHLTSIIRILIGGLVFSLRPHGTLRHLPRTACDQVSCIGHALWEPNPGEPYSRVEVGDVGFVREGSFHRLFNALLSADDPSQKFGVPECYEPIFQVLNPSDHINIGTLKPNHYYSYGISVVDTGSDVRASPKDFPHVSYLCRRRQCGAALFLPVPAQRQDAIARGAFGRWMIKHIEHCLAFTRRPGRELGIERMEDIILVTGCHRTRSWANAVFLESQDDVQVSFEVQVTDVKGPNISINWPFSFERVQGAMLNWGPEGKVCH